MNVFRTIEINDLTPNEMARLFGELGSDDQAAFFAEVWKLSQEWPGAGWCMQSLGIAEQADNDTRSAISTLAAHFDLDAALKEELAATLEELIDHNGDSMDDTRAKRVAELRA